MNATNANTMIVHGIYYCCRAIDSMNNFGSVSIDNVSPNAPYMYFLVDKNCTKNCEKTMGFMLYPNPH